MNQQQRQVRQQGQQRQHNHQAKPSFNVTIEMSWVTNLTIGRNVYVKWRYSPLEHGKTQTSTVGINERVDFPTADASDNEEEDDEEVEKANEVRKEKKRRKRRKKEGRYMCTIEIKNKRKFRDLSFVLREVDEKGRSHDIGHGLLCLSNLVGKELERQVLLELDADPKKSSTLLLNKRPILCLHVKVSKPK